jgi:hypothetical protein
MTKDSPACLSRSSLSSHLALAESLSHSLKPAPRAKLIKKGKMAQMTMVINARKMSQLSVHLRALLPASASATISGTSKKERVQSACVGGQKRPS